MKTIMMLLVAALSFSSCSDSKQAITREGTVIGKAPPIDADDLDDLYLEVKVEGNKDTLSIPVDSATYVSTEVGDKFEGVFVK